MSSRVLAGLSAAVLLCTAAAAHAAGGPAKGQWRTTVHASDQGRRAATTFACVDDAPAAFSAASAVKAGPALCEYSRRQVENGRIDVAGSCLEADGSRVRVAARGSYSERAVRVKISRWDDDEGETPAFTADVRSRRMSASCPRP